MISKYYTVSNKEKVFGWVKLISITGGAQIIVQAIGLVSGILIIRLLPTHEYGLYTLANTMLGTMIILADGGISPGVMAQGGKVWQNSDKLGAVLATGLKLRKKFAAISLIVSTPILLYLLLKQGASWVSAVLIVAALIPAFYAALSDALLEIVPKLHQTILPLQKNQIVVVVARLLLSGITLFAFPWTYVAILATAIPRIYGNIKLRRITYTYVDVNQSPDKEVRKEILKGVKRLLPSSVYYVVSGQITIWLLSFFGNSTSIAQLGALGRFTMLLGLFSSVFSHLIFPRFARLKMEKKNIFKKFIQLNILLVMIITLVIFICYVLQNQLLWVLGKQYTNLNKEFIMMMIGGCMSLWGGIIFNLLTSRGWVMHPLTAIPVGIVGIIIGTLCINLSTLIGVIYYNIYLCSYYVIVGFVFFIYKMYTIKEDQLEF